ncbi:FadR/GntR family transcriptional regulator [Kitasatospora sp. NPDC127059]|uniref:FadR/GntR family transcriptional regulator n=1 Tax=unclassified Kitasatospora TaxID=2633591 RepID=UPI0036473FC9
MAARVMSEEDIAGLAELLQDLDEAATLDETIANDLEFHRRIAAGSGNTVLSSLIDGLSGPTTRARIWRGLTEEGASERTRQQHRAIYDAIAGRRPELAHAWATVHVAGVEQWLRESLGEPGSVLD